MHCEYFPIAGNHYVYGSRGCVLQRRALTIQEAQICLACIIQIFDFVMKHPSYELQPKETMTVEPKDLFLALTKLNMCLAQYLDVQRHKQHQLYLKLRLGQGRQEVSRYSLSGKDTNWCDTH